MEQTQEANWADELRSMLKDDVPADALITLLQHFTSSIAPVVDYFATSVPVLVDGLHKDNWREVWTQKSTNMILMDFHLDMPAAFITNTPADLSQLRMYAYFDAEAQVGYCVATAYNVPRADQETNELFSLRKFLRFNTQIAREAFVAVTYTEAIRFAQDWWTKAEKLWRECGVQETADDRQ